MATALKEKSPLIREEEYLAGELLSEIKHEWVAGQVYAMVGGTSSHETIAGNLFGELRNFLKGKRCRAFQSGMKVKTSEGNFRYPDVLVVCDKISEHDLYVQDPVILVEVLSNSTRKADKTTKMREYFSIPTLKEYLLIEQDFVDVECLRRDNGWKPEHYFLGDDVTFTSIGCTLPVEEIYERVQNEEMTAFLKAKAEEEKKQE